jgi:hypothetical protein
MTQPTFRPLSSNVLDIEFNNVKQGWEQWVLLSADRHWDHPMSDHDLQKEHLREADNRGAGILDFGDLFCVMQSNSDKRATKSAIRHEHQRDDYIDKVVNGAAEFFAPHNFWLIGTGNHETKILKHTHSNISARLAERIRHMRRSKADYSPPFCGGFSGWVVFRFIMNGTQCISKRLFYHHGYGGDAPVTKGVIQTNRMAVYLPDADLVVTGHTHNEWQFPIARLRINGKGRVYKDDQLHLKIPSYKDEYAEGAGGWEIERGAPPKTQGATWLRFWCDKTRRARREMSPIKFETTRAR